jgi:hypothetical protein
LGLQLSHARFVIALQAIRYAPTLLRFRVRRSLPVGLVDGARLKGF